MTILFLSCSQEKTYQSGRDTVKSFGDGRYQILRGPSDKQILYDLSRQITLLDSQVEWDMKNGFVIFNGQKGSTPKSIRLNLKTNEIEKE